MTSVDRDSSQITGRDILAIRSRVGAASSAEGLGALQREPLGRELAQDERQVRDHQRDGEEGDPVRGVLGPVRPVRRQPPAAEHRARSSANADAPKAADMNPARVTPIWTAARKRLGSACRAATFSPRRPRWASARTCPSRKRHERDFGAREEGTDQEEEQHEQGVGQSVVHGVPTRCGRYAGLEQPSMAARVDETGASPRRGHTDSKCRTSACSGNSTGTRSPTSPRNRPVAVKPDDAVQGGAVRCLVAGSPPVSTGDTR